MVAKYNPDVDPTRLQPYGNPHARAVSTELEAEQKMRSEVAEEMSGEGESAEENKSGGKARRRGTPKAPEGHGKLTKLEGSDNLWVTEDNRVIREDGTVEAVLASPSVEPQSKAEAAGVRESEANDPDNDASKSPAKASDKSAEERAKSDPGTRTEANNPKTEQGSNVTAAGKEPDKESVAGQPKVDVSDTKP